jgi:Cft2 family RNA processing exonuclease
LDKLHETFARYGIEDWQELYTLEDVNDCFCNHMKILSFNETTTFENFIKLTPVSSGLHIGSCNWSIELGCHKIGIIGKSSEEGDFRHPSYLSTEHLKDLDLMLVSTIARNSTTLNFNNQLKHFFDKLHNCLTSSPNSKVLIPA